MYGFTDVGHRCLYQTFFDVVFDGFYVVIGCFFYFNNPFSLLFVKRIDPRLQEILFFLGECANVGEFGVFGLKAQPFDFDANTVGNKCIVGQVGDEVLQLVGVSIVELRERGEVHG
jgi:hypothetical protein